MAVVQKVQAEIHPCRACRHHGPEASCVTCKGSGYYATFPWPKGWMIQAHRNSSEWTAEIVVESLEGETT